MNLMFRKNFGGDKGPSASGDGAGRTGIGSYGPVLSSVGGAGGVAGSCVGSGAPRLALRPSIGAIGGRGQIRRSREFGYYPMEEHPSHAYRTHLFLSPPAGVPEEPEPRLGPGPRRNSGPHVIKWGGGGAQNNPNANQQQSPASNPASAATSPGTINANKRKQQNGNNQGKEPSEPPTPTASRQVPFFDFFFFL